MKFSRQGMVRWYNVRQLAATMLKSIISTIFGNFADKREIQAALSKGCHFDYSRKDEIWIDYISDLGDGFDSTYTLAHLMKEKAITCDGITLPRANILIMGGDEVYPTPEKAEYENRLQGPYNAAFPWDDAADRPHLFALPGNHDWYDGLTNFLKLFCQDRALGNWHTQQKRSYFALKLPHNYWIWGIDVQLDADIDKPQLDYFKAASQEMEVGAKVILCTAEPSWVYHSLKKKDASYARLKFFEDKYIHQMDGDKKQPDHKGFQHVATLTGDLHHYSHYSGHDLKYDEERHLITAGGGGAFMHPTHFLKETITVNDSPFHLRGNYPPRKNSRLIAFWNLAFPIKNLGLPLTIGIFHLITSWFLQSATQHQYASGPSSFMEAVQGIGLSLGNIPTVLTIIGKSISHAPSVVILNLLLVSGIIAFADTNFGRHKWNLTASIPHALLQLINFYFLVWLFSTVNLNTLELQTGHPYQILLFTTEMLLIGGLISGLLFGIYLIASTLIFESHPTEAYSSLRWTGYKNFIRINISKTGATVYAIGIRRVVKKWKNTGTEDKPKFEGGKIAFELIETVNLK